MRRGSTYRIFDPIVDANDQPIDNRTVKKIWFQLGDIRKEYPKDATYDDDKKGYWIKLSQEDTLKFDKVIRHQDKVLFITGDVAQTSVEYVKIDETMIEEVI